MRSTRNAQRTSGYSAWTASRGRRVLWSTVPMRSAEMGRFVFFFFSSRRRHTRLQGDWSSDVCSSDLQVARRDPDVLAERQQLGLGQPLTDVLLAGLQLRGALNDALERLATDELARHR